MVYSLFSSLLHDYANLDLEKVRTCYSPPKHQSTLDIKSTFSSPSATNTPLPLSPKPKPTQTHTYYVIPGTMQTSVKDDFVAGDLLDMRCGQAITSVGVNHCNRRITGNEIVF